MSSSAGETFKPQPRQVEEMRIERRVRPRGNGGRFLEVQPHRLYAGTRYDRSREGVDQGEQANCLQPGQGHETITTAADPRIVETSKSLYSSDRFRPFVLPMSGMLGRRNSMETGRWELREGCGLGVGGGVDIV